MKMYKYIPRLFNLPNNISTKLYNSYTITLVKWSRKKERKDNILIDVRGSLWFFAKKKKNWKVLEAIFTRHLHRNVRNAFDRIYAANEWTLPAVCNARLPDFHVRHIDFCSTSKMAVAVDAFRPHPHRTVIESSRWFQLEVTSGICNARIDEIGKLLVNYLNERARVLWKRLVSMDVFFFFCEMKMRPNGSFFFISSLIDRFSESLLEFFQILLNFKVSTTKYLLFLFVVV